jgi:predicted Fe-S protein YdhL (DUF1289 family)
MKSPCVKICQLDENNICVGCGRHIDEIKQAGIETKKQFLAALLAEIKENENTRTTQRIRNN